MDYKNIAQEILNNIGGKENVLFATHCVTRLRLTLKNKKVVNTEKIKQIEGVLGVVDTDAQYQIIIGQTVASVYDAFIQLTGSFKTKQELTNDEKETWWNKLLDILAGIFTPIMPIIAGAGMLKAILSILTLFNWINIKGNTYYFLKFIADASYYFLPIFLANSAAKKFKTNQYMAMLMGGILLHPSFTALKETGDFVTVLGLPVKMVTYASSVIPIILIVFVLSYIDKWVDKITPDMVKFIAKPVVIILIMMPLNFVVIGPIGSIIGDGLVGMLLAVEKISPWIMPTIIGAFMPFLVMTGMHYSLLPAYVSSLSKLGHETIIGPGNLPSNIAQGAAALSVAMKTKNKKFRQLAISSGVTALLGVTEPALFGVNLKLKKPLIATTIGGGLGGLYAGITGVMRFGGGGAGLAALGLYVGDNSSNLINAIISAAIAFVVTFFIQWKLGFEDVVEDITG